MYATCFAVFYAPLDEDYGYTTVEAFQAAKPVITATDSGGVLEFVEDGVTGCVAPPDPSALAERIAELFEHKERCKERGRAGQRAVASIRWDITVERLLAP